MYAADRPVSNTAHPFWRGVDYGANFIPSKPDYLVFRHDASTGTIETGGELGRANTVHAAWGRVRGRGLGDVLPAIS